jgi:hypothetical protein
MGCGRDELIPDSIVRRVRLAVFLGGAHTSCDMSGNLRQSDLHLSLSLLGFARMILITHFITKHY